MISLGIVSPVYIPKPWYSGIVAVQKKSGFACIRINLMPSPQFFLEITLCHERTKSQPNWQEQWYFSKLDANWELGGDYFIQTNYRLESLASRKCSRESELYLRWSFRIPLDWYYNILVSDGSQDGSQAECDVNLKKVLLRLADTKSP